VVGDRSPAAVKCNPVKIIGQPYQDGKGNVEEKEIVEVNSETKREFNEKV
jgi:hypothetical protein